MKISSITIYFSTLSVIFLCFGCLPDKQTNNRQSEIPAQAIELQQSASRKHAAKDFQGCLEDSEKALSIDNNFALAHFYKGLCQYFNGQVQEGIGSMETASIIAKNKGRNDVAEKFSVVVEELKKNESAKTPSIPKNTDSFPEGKSDNPSPSNSGTSDLDREFLVSVENRLNEQGFVWDTWNTLDWKEKVKIGRSACQTMGDPLAAIDILLSSYGDSIKQTPKNISMRLAAVNILHTGTNIYCPEVGIEGLRTIKRNAQRELDSQEEARQKLINDLLKSE